MSPRPNILARFTNGPRIGSLSEMFLAVFALAWLLVLAGCSTPIGADRLPPRAAFKQHDRNALDASQPSSETARVLHRYDLEKAFNDDPQHALQQLHEQACRDDRRDVLYALAELNYLEGARLRRSPKAWEPRLARNYHLASAIYAYFYLLGEGTNAPSPFDRRFRVACDIYNWGLAQGLAAGPQTNAPVDLDPGTRLLAPGPVALAFDPAVFKWKLDQIECFLPANEYSVRGLSVRDRTSGLGAPLIAVGKNVEQNRFPRRIPATVFLRLDGSLQDWSAGRLKGSLELYSIYEADTVEVGGRALPLEGDITAPLAYGLNDAWVWQLGAAQFFSAQERIQSDVYFTQPYHPGRVPVVFVHGTFSSPVWWAEMWNTLRADPVLRERYQFWNFVYNSGQPISISAARLRAALTNKVHELDPQGTDPAMQRMVLIGHSQGGLLAKLMATDTGDQLWRVASQQDFASLDLPPEVRETLSTNFFFTRLPFVERVVFISTPHRGSYLATEFVRRFARLFIKLPTTAINTPASLLQLDAQHALPPEIRNAVPTSLDGMSPKNKWLLALAEIPPAPGVTAHSIVAIKGDDQPPKGGDGVVKYQSAHVPYVASEKIVRSGHSCQDKPPTIEEVRRILLEHLGLTAAGGASAATAATP